MTADGIDDTDGVVQECLAELRGQAAPVAIRWTYRADDPYAVTLGIRTPRRRWVTWLMARDLLVAGLVGPTGVGQVRLCPFQAAALDRVRVELGAPHRALVVEVDWRLLEQFVLASTDLVPLGAEHTRIDLDAEIEQLTTSGT